MRESPPQLPKKPVARTEKVEDLVHMVHRGRVRVPSFQRGLKWEASNVVDLFDSIYRGYPIGSLLFYQQPAKASQIRVGPLLVDAPEEAEAWWVVDGQQRLTALTACLLRPMPLPVQQQARDPYVLYFDVREKQFQRPPRSGAIPTTWVPLPKLLDASELTEWAFGWQHREDVTLRRQLFETGARIREYPIPLYLIETRNEEAAQQIFYRTNQAGKPLKWPEVHKALFGGKHTSPSNLEDLSKELMAVGMGQLSEERLLTCLFGLRGLDPTRTPDEHYRRDPAVLRNAVQEALPVLRSVLSFLRRDAGIPHTRLLPKSILLDVLTRFFGLHPEPSPRVRALLSRWFWRIVLGAGAFNDRTLRRRGIKAIIKGDEEESVQRLLSLVDRKRSRAVELPTTFDGRSDDNRIVLLALAHLAPRNLKTGQVLEVATLVEAEGKEAFIKIIHRAKVEGTQGPANRILHPSGTLLENDSLRQGLWFHHRSTIDSHAISKEALCMLDQENYAEFLRDRAETLTAEVRRFAARMAAWDQSDRPSIDYILKSTEAASR